LVADGGRRCLQGWIFLFFSFCGVVMDGYEVGLGVWLGDVVERE